MNREDLREGYQRKGGRITHKPPNFKKIDNEDYIVFVENTVMQQAEKIEKQNKDFMKALDKIIELEDLIWGMDRGDKCRQHYIKIR